MSFGPPTVIKPLNQQTAALVKAGTQARSYFVAATTGHSMDCPCQICRSFLSNLERNLRLTDYGG